LFRIETQDRNGSPDWHFHSMVLLNAGGDLIAARFEE
jgi:hypothetical protein